MILKREVIKKIEYYFYNYKKVKKCIDEITVNIAQASSYVLDISGVHGTNISNPTEHRAELIEKKCDELRRWVKVVEATFRYFEDDLKGELAKRVYLNMENATAIQNALYISERTFYTWKADVINYAALKACEGKLISI